MFNPARLSRRLLFMVVIMFFSNPLLFAQPIKKGNQWSIKQDLLIIRTNRNPRAVFSAYLDLMQQYHRQGAMQSLNKVVNKYQEFLPQYLAYPVSISEQAQAYFQLGYYSQIINRTDISHPAYALAYQIAPDTETRKQALFYQGLSYLSERTYSGCSIALPLFQQITATYPPDSVGAKARFFIALTQHRLGDKESALAGFQSFIDQNPDSEWAPRAMYMSAMSYVFYKRDYAKSSIYFDRTIDWLTAHDPQGLDPKVVPGIEDKLVISGLAHFSCMNRSYDHSMPLLVWGEKVQTIFPPESEPYQFAKVFLPLVELQMQNNWAELLRRTDLIIKQQDPLMLKWNNVSGSVYFLRGWALEGLNRRPEALKLYRKVINEYPGTGWDAESLRRMAEYYDQRKEYQKELATYDQFIARCSSGSYISVGYVRKAEILAQLNQYAKAVAVLDAFMKQHKNSFEATPERIDEVLELQYRYQRSIFPNPEPLEKSRQKTLRQ